MFKSKNTTYEIIDSMKENLQLQNSFEENNKKNRLKKAEEYLVEASNIFKKSSINQISINNLNSAIDLLHSAMVIYDDYNLESKSDEILSLLEKIGKKNHKTHNSKQILQNYKSTGTAFDYDVDDNKLEVEDSSDNELSENSDNTFEDEP